MFNLLPYLSVMDNVLLPLSFAPERHTRAVERGGPEAEARRLIASLGLDLEELAQVETAALSVGQQQRLAAARALIGAPAIVVADEPTSALDRDRQEAFLDLLFAELAKAGSTLIMVSHEKHLANRFDRVVQIESIGRSSRDEAGTASQAAARRERVA
jgi:putative ABC transport system ATP-binding protein